MYPFFLSGTAPPKQGGPRVSVSILQDGMMLIKQPGCPMRRFDGSSTSFGQRQTRSGCCKCSLSHTDHIQYPLKLKLGLVVSVQLALLINFGEKFFTFASSCLFFYGCEAAQNKSLSEMCSSKVVRCLNMFSVCGRLHRKKKRKQVFATSVCITWKETSWCSLCQ